VRVVTVSGLVLHVAVAMVMPRSRSSGALSIESNDRNWFFGLCFCKHLVIAAVSGRLAVINVTNSFPRSHAACCDQTFPSP